ncbi:hypothetical protein K443DRAFT_11409 [Laccaria amethystina LaAM-08-1]|uniref:Unplaced genomic scaffold K443scaffold_222, whole genome shotgun sequence n=1 Tax=Laccaria amethystina LaAM-08-1 TaxID=1095629 RepID=A0A0C9WTQ9_9AGAR|nr:hypothetical protein K443DRAFT_11409 [Laccaria amethystina LaAM-08-1]
MRTPKNRFRLGFVILLQPGAAPIAPPGGEEPSRINEFLRVVHPVKHLQRDPDTLGAVPPLREEVLERFIEDCSDYMQKVSIPPHEYTRAANMYIHSLTIHPSNRDPSLYDAVRNTITSTRGYTHLVLRLRTQAEEEAIEQQKSIRTAPPPLQEVHFLSLPAVHPRLRHPPLHIRIMGIAMWDNCRRITRLGFRSQLFPSSSRSAVAGRARMRGRVQARRSSPLGDVAWDVAVGDEGNVGRLVWDGSYLIDLDFLLTTVIRSGLTISNPILHIDVSPWGEESAANLQLLQDRIRTETPQGAYHNVVRWVHRSSFTIRLPTKKYPSPPPPNSRGQTQVPRMPIPEAENLFVHSRWYGTIVVETETNEALVDLQERSAPGVFSSRPRGGNGHKPPAQFENKKVL